MSKNFASIADYFQPDFVITSLRTMWGLSLNRLEEEFGTEFKQYCLGNAQTYLDSGKLEIRDNTLFLSKEGIFISDGNKCFKFKQFIHFSF